MARLSSSARREPSHFHKTNVNERINLKAVGAKAKRYQVKQIRSIMVKYNLDKEDAIENAEKASQLWIKIAKEDGIDIPTPKGKLMYA